MELDDIAGMPGAKITGDWGKGGPNLGALTNSTPLAGAEYHQTIASSQGRAREYLGESIDLPYLILAESISSAYGRQGRPWWTGPGCISMSLLWQPEAAARANSHLSGLISIATALAVIDLATSATAGELIPGRDLTLHWPNDVYLRGRKLSGILIEKISGDVFAIGVGINVNTRVNDAPSDLQPIIASLRDEVGFALPREVMLIDFIRRFFALTELAVTSSGRNEIIARANELCIQIGRQTNVVIGDVIHSGPCVAVDATGGLALEIDGNPRVFQSGEITTTEVP